MPFYLAVVRPDLLDRATREAFAGDVVSVHCDITGAPPSFVHVLVVDDEGGRLPAGANAAITGTIRSGRTDEQKADLALRLSRALADRAGVDAGSVSTTTRDIGASFTMEGGELLPEPGSPEEAAWKMIGST